MLYDFFLPTLEEDIRALVGAKPVLLTDVIGGLRGGMRCGGTRPPSGRRWRNLNDGAIEGWLRERGFHFGAREHGAGMAIYVASEPFTEVIEGRRGRLVPVWPY